MALSRADHIRALAERIATDFFICMLNPTFRGRAFDYLNFDIENWVSSMIGTNLAKAPTDQELEVAGQHGRQIWDRWVKQAGEGLPKPLPPP